MAGLSSDLIERCVEIFSRCDEFGTDEELISVFTIEELVVFQNSLPQSKNKKGRINLTIDHLNGKYLKDKRPVFPIFIEQLCKRYKEPDSRHDDLRKLQIDFQCNLDTTKAIEVPFVGLGFNVGHFTSGRFSQAPPWSCRIVHIIK